MNSKTGVDLKSPAQKMFAFALIIGFLFFINWLTPPLTYFIKNLYITVPALLLIMYIVFNPYVVWNMFTTLSWKLTQKFIGYTKIEQLWKYHEYILSKVELVNSAEKNVGKQKILTANKIKDRQQSFNRNVKMGDGIKAQADKALIDKLIPRLEQLTAQQESLQALYSLNKTQAENLKYSTETLVDEYKTMKEISGAADAANSVLGEDNSVEAKVYNEALTQLVDEAAMFASNIENFEFKVRPQLENAAKQEQFDNNEGAKLIEEYKQSLMEVGNFSGTDKLLAIK